MSKKYIGHPLQIAGVEEYRMVGGKADNMRFLSVRNGLGLEFNISADRCADITRLSFEGCNMSYMSPAGYAAPTYYNPGEDGSGFLNSFTCGFMTTCGFNNIGAANRDEGELLGLHGTLSHTPAENIYYTEDEDAICINAIIRDGKLFNQKLLLRREYLVSKIENKFTITDVVENEGSRPEPLMLLYHMNMGYPLLDEHSLLKVSSSKVEPRDERAAEGIDTWNQMLEPEANFAEQCYYHLFDADKGQAKLFSPTISKGLAMTFDTDTLPLMTEWKMMGEKDYVLGLEPCNHKLQGRGALRAENALKYLAPGEKETFTLAFEFYNNQAFY